MKNQFFALIAFLAVCFAALPAHAEDDIGSQIEQTCFVQDVSDFVSVILYVPAIPPDIRTEPNSCYSYGELEASNGINIDPAVVLQTFDNRYWENINADLRTGYKVRAYPLSIRKL